MLTHPQLQTREQEFYKTSPGQASSKSLKHEI